MQKIAPITKVYLKEKNTQKNPYYLPKNNNKNTENKFHLYLQEECQKLNN